MADISYDEVVKLAEQLPEPEQNQLIYHLRVKQAEHKTLPPRTRAEQMAAVEAEAGLARNSDSDASYREPTREELIQELDALRAAGAFKNVDSLYGKYANPDAAEISEEAFHADLHAIATEWEAELDEFDTQSD